jgi:hypothetical protein
MIVSTSFMSLPVSDPTPRMKESAASPAEDAQAREISAALAKGAEDGWQGLPAAPSVPGVVSMTATFRCFDPAGKTISVASKPTEVYLRSK